MYNVRRRSDVMRIPSTGNINLIYCKMKICLREVSESPSCSWKMKKGNKGSCTAKLYAKFPNLAFKMALTCCIRVQTHAGYFTITIRSYLSGRFLPQCDDYRYNVLQ